MLKKIYVYYSKEAPINDTYKCILDVISKQSEFNGLEFKDLFIEDNELDVEKYRVKEIPTILLLDENDVSSIPLSYRKIIRVLYQKPPLIPEYTVIQTMEYGGVLYGISKKEMRAQADELLAKVGLSDCTHLKTSSLSGGMKQRLAIAQMLLGDAKILLFDEPTAGLDITERLKFKKIVEGLKKEHIIIYSTHIYSDLEDLADRLVVLENGKCSYSADIGCIEGMSIQEFVEKGLETGEWQKHI